MRQNSRRLKRMSRSKKKPPGFNLVSLMDVFTILVFFLLVNSSSTEVMEPPKSISLPASIVEKKPRETVVVLVTSENILVMGQPVISTEEALNIKASVIEEIKLRLIEQRENIIGLRTQVVARSKEVTVLADKTVPFKLLKKVMSSCTAAGYGKISLAVIQKASQTDT
ncbi:Adventurous gliding motility protein S [hydrothermal vent metagenome]|uniref:Adventurous gliding motility protein S n=1 Tax=hydrothermal vent metagenome TaxID=652676 RepID=A0A3B0X151_9ZZZZ